MTATRAENPPVRSGSGCATAVGLALILAGGFALWANLAGAQLVLALLDLLPLAAVWWPAILVAWGVWKLLIRLRTGEARFGCLEIVLLILVVLLGTSLTLARQAIEGHRLRIRFAEITRWAEEQAAPLPQHPFVTERVIGLPEEAVEVALTLPAGGILIREQAPAEPEGGETVASPEGAAELALPASREARFTLTTRVWAASREEAASRAEAVRLMAAPEPGGVRFSVGVEDAGGSEVAFDLVAVLPSGVGISAVSGRGPVRIAGTFGPVSAQTSDGPLSVAGAGGEVSLVARDGTVHASEIGGPLRIRGRRGAVEVESASGPVSVESDGAPVWIAHAAASVTVRGGDAPVEVSHAVGPVQVEGQIAPITLRQIAGEARVRSDYGAVRALAVGGPLGIRTESAAVEVRGSRSGVEISGGGGILLLDGVAGPVTVTSGRAEVLASGLSGPATFVGEAGAITVRGFEGALIVDGGDAALDVVTDTVSGEVSLTTRWGDVRLEIPAAGSFAVSAETEGAFASDFDLERVPGDPAPRWTGSVGSGSHRVRVSTRSGDVEIRAAETSPPENESS